LEDFRIKKQQNANKKYNACRRSFFTEKESTTSKYTNLRKLIEHDAARIIFKPLATIK